MAVAPTFTILLAYAIMEKRWKPRDSEFQAGLANA